MFADPASFSAEGRRAWNLTRKRVWTLAEQAAHTGTPDEVAAFVRHADDVARQAVTGLSKRERLAAEECDVLVTKLGALFARREQHLRTQTHIECSVCLSAADPRVNETVTGLR